MADPIYEDANGKPIATVDISGYEDALGKPVSAGPRSNGKPADPLTTYYRKQQTLGGAPGVPNPDPQEAFRRDMGRDIPSGMSFLGSMFPEAPIIGGAIGTGLGEGLRRLAPKLFGNDPGQDQVGSDVVNNVVLPAVTKGASKLFTAPRQVAADAARIGYKTGSPSVNGLVQASDNFSTSAKAAYDEASQKLNQEWLQSVKNAKNLHDATPFSNLKTLDVPNPPDIPAYREPELNLSNVKQILQNYSEKTKNDTGSGLLRYAKNKLLLSIPAALLGGGVGAGAGVAGTVVLGEEGLRRLMRNPETAQLTLQAIKTPGANPEAYALSKTIYSALRGLEVTVNGPDGDTVPAKFSEDGQLQYLRK